MIPVDPDAHSTLPPTAGTKRLEPSREGRRTANVIALLLVCFATTIAAGAALVLLRSRGLYPGRHQVVVVFLNASLGALPTLVCVFPLPPGAHGPRVQFGELTANALSTLPYVVRFIASRETVLPPQGILRDQDHGAVLGRLGYQGGSK